MRHRRQVRFAAAGAVITIALLAGGCTNPAPPGGSNVALHVLEITSLEENENGPNGFWENPPWVPYPGDGDDEPYLVHLGVRIKLNEPVKIETNASSVESTGSWMCDLDVESTCQAGPFDAVPFYGVYYPDLFDLADGSQPFELIGSVELMFEKDSPPFVSLGVTQTIQNLTSLLNTVITPLIQNNGTIPTTPQGLLNFLSAVLPPLIGTLLAFVGTNILGAIFGMDEYIGAAPMFFFAVGGTLSEILKAILPTLLPLINQYVMDLPDSPFPNGLPVALGVLGQYVPLEFGAEFQTPFTHYRTLHHAASVLTQSNDPARAHGSG